MDMNMSMNMEDIEKKTMTIVSEDGTEEVVEVILAFEFKDNKRNISYIQKMKKTIMVI